MNLYELTRALVARGCPEHPILTYLHNNWFVCVVSTDGREIIDGEGAYARDLWTMHALRWWLGMATVDVHHKVTAVGTEDGIYATSAIRDHTDDMVDGEWPWQRYKDGADILEAIEAATRNMGSR